MRRTNSAVAEIEEVDDSSVPAVIVSPSQLGQINQLHSPETDSSVAPIDFRLTGTGNSVFASALITSLVLSFPIAIQPPALSAATINGPMTTAGMQVLPGGYIRFNSLTSWINRRDANYDMCEGGFFGLKPSGLELVHNAVPKSKSKEDISSDVDYQSLAAKYPERLVSIVRSASIRPSQLTFAAEALGLLSDSNAVRSALLPLLDHPAAVVREGAIYGLSNHLNEEAIETLQRVAQSDLSPGVRQAAAELLDE